VHEPRTTQVNQSAGLCRGRGSCRGVRRAACGVHIHCCLRPTTVDPPALRIDYVRERAGRGRKSEKKASERNPSKSGCMLCAKAPIIIKSKSDINQNPGSGWRADTPIWLYCAKSAAMLSRAESRANRYAKPRRKPSRLLCQATPKAERPDEVLPSAKLPLRLPLGARAAKPPPAAAFVPLAAISSIHETRLSGAVERNAKPVPC
jgi:hypothetical protein